MKIAFDSNVLCYLAEVCKTEGDEQKKADIDRILLGLPENVPLVVPYQALGECYHVMMRFGYSRDWCRSIINYWIANLEPLPSTETAFMSAIDLATDHKLQFWDALILSVSAEAGSTLLLSEDLQPGFTWRGVTVVNPFAVEMDRRLARLLTE